MPDSPKILHVSNPANVAFVIAKFTDRIYHTESLVVQRKASNSVGFQGVTWDSNKYAFTWKCLSLARKFDLIHVHSFWKMTRYVRFLYWSKPIVLHFHGDDIRNRWNESVRWKYADHIYCVSKDIMAGAPSSVELLMNPVDTEVFYPRNVQRKHAALHFHVDYYGNESLDLARKIAKKSDLPITVLSQNIAYSEMPNLLSSYEYYIDVKHTHIIHGAYDSSVMSKTALEALACGCKVIDFNNVIHSELPQANTPECAAGRVFEIYQKLLR
jgi:glycosyltransferase involved in cell wall biosynthesis